MVKRCSHINQGALKWDWGPGGEANIVGLNIISKNSVRKLDCMEKQNLTQLWLLGYRYVVSCQEDKKETYLQTTLFFYYDQWSKDMQGVEVLENDAGRGLPNPLFVGL